MKANQTVASDEWQVTSADSRTAGLVTRHSSRVTRSAFSLIEVMVVVALMSLIVLALMAVFTSTQRAFRSAVTQTDVLEGSRAAMDLIATDLRGLTPSDGVSNLAPPTISCPVNFFVLGNNNYSTAYQPLRQSLPGSTISRTNVLNYFFILSRNNTKWTSVGYVVDNTNSSPLYPLYRFYGETNITTSPLTLYDNFYTAVANSQWTNMSHLVDGVVHLTLHAYDPNGVWINRNSFPTYTNALNTYYLSTMYGEPQIYMLSNAVPAAVELELGVLEDRALARAESLPHNSTAQLNYLAQQSGTVHVFRQRVNIPNVDTTAYP
jgi:type II secretory pathway pseudopilin PulG